MVNALKFPTSSLVNILMGISIFITLTFYFSFSDDDKIIQIIVTLLLAEPHFFLTIPLLILYKELFIENRIIFVYLPILLLFSLVYLFFYNIYFFYYIFLLSNLFHVNRQSQGVVKLCLKEKSTQYTQYLWIYYSLFSVLFIIPHLIPQIKENIEYKVTLSLFAFSSFFIIKKYLKIEKLNFKDNCIALSGLLVFWPSLFFENFIFAMGAGISIHYLQYIMLAGKIISKQFNKLNILWILIAMISYATFSTLALSGNFTVNKNSIFILIPTLVQMFHFYYDSFIWKMSNLKIKNIIKSSFV